MTAAGFAPEWLALREPADADARAADLLGPLRAVLPDTRLVVLDLGCGTGSMRRWLSARLDQPQHWILQDRDPQLLELAASTGEGSVELRDGELAALRREDLAGVSLVTASALLDVLTADEVDGLVTACVEAGCPALLTLTVTGRVELDPPGPWDERFEAAFNQHQRRHLLGPGAVPFTLDAFRRRGARVLTRPSPWRLDPGPLAAEWLRGWVGAACEQVPDLTASAPDYLRRADDLRVVVHHADVLAIPGPPP
ncbi:class I SAM-dependent methyltransferase [Saccharopolyspora rhizosphaerae]|uniref:Class I SAM-dependent methyltransferase n=1 Tax=Saccharopolyspora rhizosphaerae TaxID=2492662 RepID=A0A426JTY5_9PSEU|nr:class I SAM-dependent methyltransferase [Saccharopolyspora rhizosphaerae]RRO16670.1 class I SAM-dependent methyltransferase [Saccharopolyspora rhizosphaerae]